MSKKDKSKFRRRLRAEILKGMEQGQTIAQPTPAPATVRQSVSQPVSQPAAKPIGTPIVTLSHNISAPADTLQLVRHDLKKSAIIIGSIIIIIVALYFIDQKTGILLKAGNEIFKVLHIGG